LLERFRALFDGTFYNHRISTNGDHAAVELFEDLHAMGVSKIAANVDSGHSVLNRANLRHGVVARRGDGSFGEIIHGVAPVAEDGFTVKRGPIATIEIGIEVKILQKAMIKQIDRVCTDLKNQVTEFKSKGGRPICVGIVGINHADYAVSFEGRNEWRTDGRTHKHPVNEAADAERHLMAKAAPHFDEFLILKYKATNDPPYPFEWFNPRKALTDYAAALTRIRAEYQLRF
jgi:hypothetical protein